MITLAEVQKNTTDALQIGVIDEFRKSNFLLNNMPFADAVSPVGGGGTLTYGYTRLVTQPTAAFREINHEYTPQNTEKQRHTVDLKVFGGSFEIDRVLASMGGIVDEVTLQMAQKIKAAQALFNDAAINGDSAVDANAFDGLDKALTGSSTEMIPSMAIDLSTSAAVTSNATAFLDMLDEFLLGLDGPPDAIMGNTKLIARIRACARRAAMYNVTKDDWGRQVESYGVIPLVDLGAKPGSNNPIVSIGTGDNAGLTSLYAARLATDGFHGVSLAGTAPIKSWMPHNNPNGEEKAVQRGGCEMVAAVVLKATKAAAVLRKIKVA